MRTVDFADALHLGTVARCDYVLTFDGRFIQAADDSPVAVRKP